VKKLQNITESKKACPDLVLIPGEDLTPYRTASRALLHVLSNHPSSSIPLHHPEAPPCIFPNRERRRPFLPRGDADQQRHVVRDLFPLLT